MEVRNNLPDLEMVMVVDSEQEENVLDFWSSVEKGSRYFTPVSTKAEDPALIIYTSGTTGPPKGALHAHRVLLEHLPGVEFLHNLFPKEGDFFWIEFVKELPRTTTGKIIRKELRRMDMEKKKKGGSQ